MPDQVAEAAKTARQQLKDISRGEIVLPSTPVTATSQGAPLYEAPERLFTRKSLENY
jgi:hypothetical protein